MKKSIGITLAAATALILGGCQLTGQITIFQSIDVGAATNTVITPVSVDLDEESDYTDHMDDIKSVDGISVVAVIKNNLASPARVKLYLSTEAKRGPTVPSPHIRVVEGDVRS